MEDYEVIVKQLFSGELKDLLKPEHYEVIATGLATESIITSSEAKSLVTLGVSRDEFEQGERWTGASFHPHNGQYRHKASALIISIFPSKPIATQRQIALAVHRSICTPTSVFLLKQVCTIRSIGKDTSSPTRGRCFHPITKPINSSQKACLHHQT
jgi:hypothetical protein